MLAVTEAARERLARQNDGLERLATDVADGSPALVARAAAELAVLMEAIRAQARRASEGAPDGTQYVSATTARAEACIAAAKADLASAWRAVPSAAWALVERSDANGTVLLEPVQRYVRDQIGQANDGSRHLAVVRAAAAAMYRFQDVAVEHLRQAIETAVARRIDEAATDLARKSAALDAADPAEVLRLGYALVMDRHNRPITSAAAAKAASSLILRFNDSTVVVKLVTSIPKSGDTP